MINETRLLRVVAVSATRFFKKWSCLCQTRGSNKLKNKCLSYLKGMYISISAHFIKIHADILVTEKQNWVKTLFLFCLQHWAIINKLMALTFKCCYKNCSREESCTATLSLVRMSRGAQSMWPWYFHQYTLYKGRKIRCKW